jgi:hypothetical protein
MLTNKEIEFVSTDLQKRGITMPALEKDLLDHLLCAVEMYMAEGQSFSDAYRMAVHDLNTDKPLIIIQQETIMALSERKNVYKNIMVYVVFIFLLTGISRLLNPMVNPAVILTGITLTIFFVYHSIFQGRKANSNRANMLLFLVITSIPVIAVLLFLATEFEFQLAGITGWILLIISFAIPVYRKVVKDILSMDRTMITLLCYVMKFIAAIGLIWIPLILCLQFFRPDVFISFFVDDLVILAIGSFILYITLRKYHEVKYYLRNNLSL